MPYLRRRCHGALPGTPQAIGAAASTPFRRSPVGHRGNVLVRLGGCINASGKLHHVSLAAGSVCRGRMLVFPGLSLRPCPRRLSGTHCQPPHTARLRLLLRYPAPLLPHCTCLGTVGHDTHCLAMAATRFPASSIQASAKSHRHLVLLHPERIGFRHPAILRPKLNSAQNCL